MLCYLIVIITSLVIYILVFKRQKTWIKRNVKQVCTTPIIGDSYKSMLQKESICDLLRRMYTAFPNERYVGMHQFSIPTLLIRDLNLIKQISVKDFDHFTDHRSFTNEETDPIWSKNLFALKGEAWRNMRSTLSPTFTGIKMRAMHYLINDCANQFLTYLLNKDQQKIDLEMKDTFTRYANDVIATCAFGITVDSLKEPNNEFYTRGKEATNFSSGKRIFRMVMIMLAPTLSKWLNLKVFEDDVTNFFTDLISDSIKLREAQNIVRPDMINLLMEARKGKLMHEESEVKDTGFATVEESHIGKVMKAHTREITDLDIAAQALIFFLAGFDTVSAAMVFFSYELAVNPEIQDRLIEEVDETLKICNGELTYDSLSKMKYMDMVLTEVLRKWPPFIVADRVCVKPYTIEPVNPGEKPVQINVDEVLWIPTVAVHYDPQNYENPDTFDPERFSDENKHKIKPYSYLPFGSGPRNCIGSRFALMEIKTVIFTILTKFKFVVTEKTVIPVKLDKTQINPTAEGGMNLALERR